MTDAHVEALILEGNAREDRGELDAALERYESATRIAPASARAHLNAGNALARLGRTDEAEAAFRTATRLAPDEARYKVNLANLLAECGRLDEAENELREALRVDPALPQASVVLALLLSESGRTREAEDELRRTLDLNPQFAGAAYNLGKLLLAEDRFDEAVPYVLAGKDIAPWLLSGTLFQLNDRTDLDAQEIARRHAVAASFIERDAGPRYTRWLNDPDPDKVLRVGYVSGDFKMHPLALFMKPVLEHHDGRKCEVHCYFTSLEVDNTTWALRQVAPHWHDVAGLTDEEFADAVREDGIDILVDLMGHTSGNRLRAFARHPAPVQATWLGYMSSTGLAAMDYRICDRHTDPEGEPERLSTERPIRLRNSQWCYSPWWAPPDFVRDEGTAGRVRFGCVGRHSKISDACLDMWTEVLRQVPDCELSIIDVPEKLRESMRARFAARGFDGSRIVLAGRKPVHQYYALAGNLDIALDTFPYSGGTTTLDTLWMGTPVVALRGNRPAGRSAYSILKTLGLDELTATTREEYVQINVRLARDGAWRDSLRATLRQRLAASALMDAPAFVDDLESCYRTAWRAWCRNAKEQA